MEQILQPTKVRYDAKLAQHHIPKKLHPYYLKWLRYYLDFCRKYHFKEADKKSLSHFIEKLTAKNQTDQQQKPNGFAFSFFPLMNQLFYPGVHQTAPAKLHSCFS